jgi:hypothetical protein
MHVILHLYPPGTILLLLIIGPLLTACATNPVTGNSDFVLMSEEDEIRLGQKASITGLLSLTAPR